MVNVDPIKRLCFHNSFRAATEDIAVISSICSDSSNVHCKTWLDLCGLVNLNPLLVSYQYLVPILDSFIQQ